MNDAKNPGQVSGYLDDWTLAQLRAYAKSEDRSVSWVVGYALKQFFVANKASPSVSGVQVDIEDAIASTVKRVPRSSAKHK